MVEINLITKENFKDITDEDELKKGVKTIVKCEYQTIGIDDYAEYSEMDNRYLINGKFIPIKLNDKWGLATKENGVIIIPQFDTIGCKLSKKGKYTATVKYMGNKYYNTKSVKVKITVK